MRLDKDQKEQVLKWVAEGLPSDEINKRAADFVHPFSVSRAQVKWYRDTRGHDLKKMTQAAEFDALSSGLSIKAERVRKLQLLAERMETDIFGDLLWVDDVKGIGKGDDFERVEVQRFNQAEVSEYRATLDQIAGEVGDKKPDQLIPSEIVVRFMKPEEKNG